jgi:hypothetical protein
MRSLLLPAFLAFTAAVLPPRQGPFRIHDGVRLMGWLTTAVMAVAAIIMCVTTML